MFCLWRTRMPTVYKNINIYSVCTSLCQSPESWSHLILQKWPADSIIPDMLYNSVKIILGSASVQVYTPSRLSLFLQEFSWFGCFLCFSRCADDAVCLPVDWQPKTNTTHIHLPTGVKGAKVRAQKGKGDMRGVCCLETERKEGKYSTVLALCVWERERVI